MERKRGLQIAVLLSATLLIFFQNCAPKKHEPVNSPLDDINTKLDGRTSSEDEMLANIHEELVIDDYEKVTSTPVQNEVENQQALISELGHCRKMTVADERANCVWNFFHSFYSYLHRVKGWTVHYDVSEMCYIASARARRLLSEPRLQHFISTCKVKQNSQHSPHALHLNSCVIRQSGSSTAVLPHHLGPAFQHLRALVAYPTAGSANVDLLRLQIESEQPFTDACGRLRNADIIATPITVTF